MAIVDPATPINPANGRFPRVRFIRLNTVVLVAVPHQRGGRHRARDQPWLELLERVLGSWPVTLRTALLLVFLLGGVAIVAAALGVAGLLLLVLLGMRRRHVA